jgi:hypothetical protein
MLVKFYRRLLISLKRLPEKRNFNHSFPSLFLTSGSTVKMIDGWFYYSNYNNYPLQSSIINVNEYKELNHFVFGYPSWREQEDPILYWL